MSMLLFFFLWILEGYFLLKLMSHTEGVGMVYPLGLPCLSSVQTGVYDINVSHWEWGWCTLWACPVSSPLYRLVCMILMSHTMGVGMVYPLGLPCLFSSVQTGVYDINVSHYGSGDGVPSGPALSLLLCTDWCV